MKSPESRYEIKPAADTGFGYFTLVPIQEDKRIIEYTGVILTREEADREGGRFLMTLDEVYLIDGDVPTNPARFINHSCEPNAKAYRAGARVWIWSLRKIEAGEEITFDYGVNYFRDFIEPEGCKCLKCRSLPASVK